MRLDDFDYELPEELIAQTPAPRGESRLLHVTSTELRHESFGRFPRLLEPGDVLVLNDTRVIPARLFGRRADTGGRFEILLVSQQNDRRWTAMLRPGRRAKPGTQIVLAEDLKATVDGRDEGLFTLSFSRPPLPLLSEIGEIPLPPYIDRAPRAEDLETYQTVYATSPGAVAAPTAGLHFSNELLAQIRARGVHVTTLTLHVGPGTFLPVEAEDVRQHRMHSERFTITTDAAQTIRAAQESRRRIVAVGTTVVRALEASALADPSGKVQPIAGETDLFIRPGFDFRVVDALLTNFHLPRSTLLMLVSAFAGRSRVLEAYRAAVRARYRFFSYGDAMFLAARAEAGDRALV